MIDGLLMLTELGLFLLLLKAVYRAGRKKSELNLGFFAYKTDKENQKENKPLKRSNSRA